MPRERLLSEIDNMWSRSTILNHDLSKVRPGDYCTIDHDYAVADYTRLPYLQASLFGTILEDIAIKLRILVECNSELRITKTYFDMKHLLALKFSVRQPANVDELDGINQKDLGRDEYKINKLDLDRRYVIDVILSSYVDLCLHRSYRALNNTVKDIVDEDNYRETLTVDEAKNRVLRRELKKQLRQQRNHIKSAIYDTNIKIDELKTEVEDSMLTTACGKRYVENWQRSRTEQHAQTIADKECVYSNAVEYYKQRADHEQRVHMEIDLLNNIRINETMHKVEEAMNKYDHDIEAIDLKIQLKMNDHEHMHDKRVALEKMIENRDKLMIDWIHYKEEREKIRQYHDRMTSSAVIVQAWWRGLLVRLQLGPFKPVKKGKKK